MMNEASRRRLGVGGYDRMAGMRGSNGGHISVASTYFCVYLASGTGNGLGVAGMFVFWRKVAFGPGGGGMDTRPSRLLTQHFGYTTNKLIQTSS